MCSALDQNLLNFLTEVATVDAVITVLHAVTYIKLVRPLSKLVTFVLMFCMPSLLLAVNLCMSRVFAL
jgi:hypothetical protein